MFVKIHDSKLAITYNVLTFVILLYVIIYSIVIEKGYQKYENLISSTFVKVKGSVRGGPDVSIWDSTDMVVPPLLPDAVFVTTNFVATDQQERSTCEQWLSPCNCTKYHDQSLCCPAGTFTEFGMLTGDCLGEYCAVEGWCPQEQDPVPIDANVLDGVKNWTVYARVNVQFPLYNVSRSNTAGDSAPVLGRSLWTVEDILKKAATSWNKTSLLGSIIMVSFSYDCDLNRDVNECEPEITMERLDSSNSSSIASGFNFRTMWRYRDMSVPEMTLMRDMWKLYGTYIVFSVHGRAGKFDIVTTLTQLGAGLSFLAFATLACDWILENWSDNKSRYTVSKYRQVREMDLNHDGHAHGDALLDASARSPEPSQQVHGV